MLVGSKEIDKRALAKHCVSEQDIVDYVTSLVPEPVRHVRAIVDNQRYYCAQAVRSLTSIPWHRRDQMIRALHAGIKVKGVMTEIWDYWDMLRYVNVDTYNRYLEEERNNAS